MLCARSFCLPGEQEKGLNVTTSLNRSSFLKSTPPESVDINGQPSANKTRAHTKRRWEEQTHSLSTSSPIIFSAHKKGDRTNLAALDRGQPQNEIRRHRERFPHFDHIIKTLLLIGIPVIGRQRQRENNHEEESRQRRWTNSTSDTLKTSASPLR